ncbi:MULTISPECIES: helix-turn-helix domain-containing protein [Leptospira]|uniref:Transcriptional regulator, Fis family n=1 Tax=Leptospira borgpetersenii str. 200701203 TaxID=1193007 RepID=M3GUF2_LEPBO|nr:MULTISPECIES: helix-turn-helix domain-containing protein [Leptospira]EMF98458.1 transcriptional regulator, Fis family [Leptospira borgpetersenii str. 200701203]ANG99573.2 Transcriptional regulator [Leptospira borgpetersenii str. 4E]AXX14193.1 sigma-54-dependent Fis family transcriptional regulator [Leptospira borgpetersenii serovar Ceylonica]KGE26627.1 Fis family transcriptional regulator [Leptospira borgpetersenii serovar Ballum]MBE8160951.1 sigma-54-dependent Fis family transcriptional re
MNSEEHIFITNASNSIKVLNRLKSLSRNTLPLFITGGPGSGKTFVSNLIADLSGLNPRVLILDSDNIESERGLESILSEGKNTYFIFKNFPNFSKQIQVYLLKKIRESQSDSRFIFISDKEWKQKLETGQIIESLYFEISNFRLDLPDLRERKEDIPLLIRHFLETLSEKYKRKEIRLSEKLVQFLLNYDFPGNVRQLKNLLEGMISLFAVRVLDVKHLPPQMFETCYVYSEFIEVKTGIPLKDYEREIIKRNLILVNGNREKAAKILGISERTIYRKIIEFGLSGEAEGKNPPSGD